MFVVAALGLVALVYWPALHGGFIWVDKIALHDVGWLRADSGWLDIVLHNFYDWTSYFRPLVVALFIGEVRAFDLQPLPMHLVSLGLHLANTCLVGLLALRLSATDTSPAKLPWPPALAMLVYGLHPALIEPVVWISCQFELVVTFFCLLGLLANCAIERRSFRAALVASCFLLAACAKESAAVFPLLLVAYDWVRSRSGSAQPSPGAAMIRLLRRQWIVYAAVAFAGVAYLALRCWALGSLAPPDNGAPQTAFARAQLIGWLLLTYWRTLLWPMAGQGPLHEVDLRQFGLVEPHLIAIDVAVIAVLLGAAVLFARRNALGAMCVAATLALLPVLHLLPVDFDSSLYHERYAMLSAAVAAPLLPRVLSEFATRLGSRARPWIVIASIILCGWLGASVLNIRVTLPLWSDEIKLWSWALQQKPDSMLARNHLLTAYGDRGDFERARPLAAAMLADRRACPVCLVNAANVALQARDARTARAALDRAQPMLRFVAGKRLPELFELAHARLSLIDGDAADAEAHYRRAIDLEPQDPRAHMDLALLLAARDRIPEAQARARQALALFAPDQREREAAAFTRAVAAQAGAKQP